MSDSGGPRPPVGAIKQAFDNAVNKMGSLGATIIDPADVPELDRKSNRVLVPSSRPELDLSLRGCKSNDCRPSKVGVHILCTNCCIPWASEVAFRFIWTLILDNGHSRLLYFSLAVSCSPLSHGHMYHFVIDRSSNCHRAPMYNNAYYAEVDRNDSVLPC